MKYKCFQVIIDRFGSLNEVTVEHSEEPLAISDVEVNLCCQDEKHRREWVESIVGMKECTRLARKERYERELQQRRRKMAKKNREKEVDQLERDLKGLKEKTRRLKGQLK